MKTSITINRPVMIVNYNLGNTFSVNILDFSVDNKGPNSKKEPPVLIEWPFTTFNNFEGTTDRPPFTTNESCFKFIESISSPEYYQIKSNLLLTSTNYYQESTDLFLMKSETGKIILQPLMDPKQADEDVRFLFKISPAFDQQGEPAKDWFIIECKANPDFLIAGNGQGAPLTFTPKGNTLNSRQCWAMLECFEILH